MVLPPSNYTLGYDSIAEAVRLDCDTCFDPRASWRDQTYQLGAVSDLGDIQPLIDDHERKFHTLEGKSE